MSNILKYEFCYLRIIGWLAAALFTLALGACSTVKLGYNRVPDLASWWLDSYVGFNDAQSAQLRTDLNQLVAWHRAQELPRSADLLKKLQGLAAQPTNATQACAVWGEVQDHLDATLAHLAVPVSAMAASFSAAQMQHLEQRLQRNNADYLSKFAPGPGQQEFRLKALQERYEDFYGTLEEAQRAALAALIAASAFDVQRSLAERQQRQRALLQALRQAAAARGAEPEARALMRSALEGVLLPAHHGASPYGEAMMKESCTNFAAVHNAATPAQRERAVRRLAAYERDLRELAAPPR